MVALHAPWAPSTLPLVMNDADPERAERARLDDALTRASEELQLQTWYRDCVRPLLRMPQTQWPRCCGRGCEPCAETLKAVATRVQSLLDDPA